MAQATHCDYRSLATELHLVGDDKNGWNVDFTAMYPEMALAPVTQLTPTVLVMKSPSRSTYSHRVYTEIRVPVQVTVYKVLGWSRTKSGMTVDVEHVTTYTSRSTTKVTIPRAMRKTAVSSVKRRNWPPNCDHCRGEVDESRPLMH